MKIAGSLMIITFFTFLGIKFSSYKKQQIMFIDDMIYLCDCIVLILKTYLLDTDEIIKKLNNDERLKKYDIYCISEKSSFDAQIARHLSDLSNTLGKYDANSQINYICEINNFLSSKRKQYSDYYFKHSKLYFALGITMGFLITILLY